jgi:hypothetical protein
MVRQLALHLWLTLTALVMLGSVPAAASQITLRWEDNSSNEQGFSVERMTGTAGPFIHVALVAPNVNTYTDASVTVGTVYCYRVRAYNVAGSSPPSNQACSLALTFGDVSINYWAWRYVEALVAAGVTTGCGSGHYCPDGPVTRAEMAVFLLKARYDSKFVPPEATGAKFDDVPATQWAAAWIEQLAGEGVTAGCGAGNYCPESAVTRAQMAPFLLRTKYDVGYSPPPATGTPFADVPASHWAAAWIEQLVRDEITAGCASDAYCPDSFVTRAQMAVFLVRALGLPMPF